MTIHAATASAAHRAPETPLSAPELCVVVPIRNQGAHVWPLVFGLRTSLGTRSAEVLFVDDSDDDTPQIVEGVAEMMAEGRSDFRVRLVHRDPESRVGGRAGAVEAGFAASD